MKKILILTAVAFGFGLDAKAFLTENSAVELNILQDKQYNPIEISAIPADVLKNISAKFGGFTIKEAHVAKDGEYKLVLVKDEKTSTAYFTSKGEFLKEA